MELWIRTNPRIGLVKVNDICIYSREGMFSIESKDFVLGMYKTEERALEVLDEIQENIVKRGQAIILTDERGIPNGSKFFSYVYEMPKE